jgi:hypothetical protein
VKRIAIAAVAALVMLVAAGTAFAAINTYQATYSFKGSKGSASKPAPLSFQQTISVAAVTAGDRTGILHQITTQISGVNFNTKGFPTCTVAQMEKTQPTSDTACPKKALIATGSIKATLGPPASFAATEGTPCDPLLQVWNGGKGKLIFFFVDTASHQCLGGQITTGAVPPWTASYKQAGSKLDVTIPIPNTVDYPLGISGNVVGSLSYNNLHWISQSMGSKYDITSTGCSGKRAYTFGFTASLPSAGTETKSLSGSTSCG